MRIAVLANWGVGAAMLQALLNEAPKGVAIAFVLTHHDANHRDPWRRAVADLARERDLTVLSEQDTDFVRLGQLLVEHAVELVLMHAYLRIVPAEILAVPARGFVNLHASLLPRHKGRDPLAAALAAGDAWGGVTAHVATPELDDGPVIWQMAYPIAPGDTKDILLERQKHIMPELIQETLRRLNDPSFTPVPQQALAKRGISDFNHGADHEKSGNTYPVQL